MSHEPLDQPLPLDEAPSKSERKRAFDRLKVFAHELVALPASRLARLDLPDDVRRSLNETRRIESRSARKRQLLHLGNLLEGIDIGALRLTLAAMDHGPTITATVSVEDPRVTALLAGGDEAVFALTDVLARDDLQTLRQVVRLARKQLDGGGARSAAVNAVKTCLERLA